MYARRWLRSGVGGQNSGWRGAKSGGVGSRASGGGERGKERRRKPEDTATPLGGLGGCEAGLALPPSHTRLSPRYSARRSIAHSEQASSSSSADEREPSADRIAVAPRAYNSWVLCRIVRSIGVYTCESDVWQRDFHLATLCYGFVPAARLLGYFANPRFRTTQYTSSRWVFLNHSNSAPTRAFPIPNCVYKFLRIFVIFQISARYVCCV